jgi:hypothetical protein
VINPTKKAATVLTDSLGGDRTAFSIRATGKAFRILIDGLYSQKEATVVREIMSNGWDSHAAAGKPEAAIHVTCPTTLDPVFRVRDFGVSMTHAEVMHLYTTLFESTKEDTNDQLGQFGLGSKTPFAYTDSFSVTAWLDGVKRLYVLHITDEDLPQITHIADEPSDEPQGFEVSVPVRPADLDKFRKEIGRMVMSSNTPPTLDGMTAPTDLVVHEGGDYRVIRDHYGLGGFGVRQGCVIYPAPTFRTNKVAIGHTLVVDVPIGAVQVTASREALSLDDVTTQTIRTRLQEAEVEIDRYVAKVNASFPNRLAAFQAYGNHETWLNANIGKSTVALPTDQPNKNVLQQLNVYTTKTKTRPVYQFNAPQVLRILVDNGEPMVRRNLRIGEQFSKYGQKLAVVKREDLPRVVRVLGLKPSQIQTLQTIPDVVVNRTPSAYGSLAGTAAPKTLPKGQVWTIKTGAKTINRMIGDKYVQTTDNFKGVQWQELFRALNITDVVGLTVKQSIDMKADLTMQLETVIADRAPKVAAKRKLQEALDADETNAMIENFTGWYFWDNVYSETGIRVPQVIQGALGTTFKNEISKLKVPARQLDNTDLILQGVLHLTGKSALTKGAIGSKVEPMLRELKPILQDSDPVGTLVKFYIANK